MKPRHLLLLWPTLLLFGGGDLLADDLQSCARIQQADERLACYDRLAGRSAEEAGPGSPTAVAGRDAERPFGALDERVSMLDDRWELTPETRRGTFTFRPYKPIYILPLFYTDSVNQQPCREGIGPSGCVRPPLGYDDLEAKFQISFKVKIAEQLLADNGDLWVGYTQSSRWQVYNADGDLSRPFRETNHEPELMLTFRTDYHLGGYRLGLLGLGLNHQSNGNSGLLSRSWNRITAFAGIEHGPWTLSLRPWWRLQEDPEEDENPEVEDYYGRGELVLNRRAGRHNYTLTLRHSLRDGADSRGSGQFEWTFPIAGHLKGYLQVFSGYGESLVDYNHRQTTLGLGVTIVDSQ